MWQESPAGIAELLHTDLLTSDLAPVDAKPALWARKGITLWPIDSIVTPCSAAPPVPAPTAATTRCSGCSGMFSRGV